MHTGGGDMVRKVFFCAMVTVGLALGTGATVLRSQAIDEGRSSPGVASGYEGAPIEVSLYKRVGISDRLRLFATVEVYGSIWFTSKGIKRGVDSLRRLQLDSAEGKWLSITKRKLINGRAVITTEDGKTYTIFNLGIDELAGEITLGETPGAGTGPTKK